MIREIMNRPTEKSERVVVDEIFADGKARILRAPRKPDAAPDDLAIETWGEEREEFISVGLMEAFVGFRTGERLREGDVFLVADSDRLIPKYKPIPRESARKEHLLAEVPDSTREARRESKHQTYLLSAVRMAEDEKMRSKMVEKVEQKFGSEE